MNESDETLMRGIHSSMAINFGTMSPMSIGQVRFERIGFGDIPVAAITIISPDNIGGVVPIARQWVYRELETCGVSNEVVEFVPTVNTASKRVKFADTNRSSQSFGKHKMGYVMKFHFEIGKQHLHLFEFKDGRGKIKVGGIKE